MTTHDRYLIPTTSQDPQRFREEPDFRNAEIRTANIRLIQDGCVPQGIYHSEGVASLSRKIPINIEAFVDKWMNHKTQTGLYLYGEIGCGKTQLSRYILWDFLHKGVFRIAEVNAVEFALITSSIYKVPPQFLLRSDVLFVDDIEKASWNAQSLAVFYKVMDERNQHGKRTIWTSSLDSNELIVSLQRMAGNLVTAPAAFDRMKPVTKIHYPGESRR